MKFGKVDHLELIDFTLPPDHPSTKMVLSKFKNDNSLPTIYVGCAKWNRQDLKGFYPRGTKDELVYYASQFNSIELNATFYRFFPPEQFEKWYSKTPANFKFFPKLNQEISHWKRLNTVQQSVDNYVYAAANLKEKLGTIFLQMHSNFAPKDIDRVLSFVDLWPKEIPLAIEFRHTDWYNKHEISKELYRALEENHIANVLVDTAGRRDLLHMKLTNNEAFIRYVGANHKSDYKRLDDWVLKLKEWSDLGLQKIHFFVHQNLELASPLLSAYFIEKLNAALGSKVVIPTLANEPKTLF